MITSRPENIDKIFAQVKKPSRYIGNEFNACSKSWDEASLKVALVFPDLYEIGMSHHGLQLLYSIINEQPELLADRVYAPDRDFEELLLASYKIKPKRLTDDGYEFRHRTVQEALKDIIK